MARGTAGNHLVDHPRSQMKAAGDLVEDSPKWTGRLHTHYSTQHILPCLEPAVYPAVLPPGDGELLWGGRVQGHGSFVSPSCPTHNKALVNACLRKAQNFWSLTHAVTSYPIFSFLLLQWLWRGVRSLSQSYGDLTKLKDMVFVPAKHLIMAWGHHPMGSSPRPGVQYVLGLCLRISLTHQVATGSLSDFWRLFLLL